MIVLLVEGDDTLRRLLEQVLPPEFEVRSCSNEMVGLRRLDADPDRVQLLLIEISPDPSSGDRLVARARALPHRVGVVVMSDDAARLETWRARADAVVARPYVVGAVRAALRRAAVRVS